jgi:hypothetical protein
VGDDLPAKWHGLEFRNWGLVELRNYELSIRGLPVGTYLGFCGSAVQGCWVTAGVLDYCWAGVLGCCDSAKFDCTRSSRGGGISHDRLSHSRTKPYGFNPHHLFPISSMHCKFTTRADVPASSQPVLTTLHIPCTHHLHSSQPCTHRPHYSQPSDFLIAAPTNSVRAIGIGALLEGKKKNLFVRAIPTSW